MRADRLVAILLMLQSKGRVTAAEVATELEISERTARRDLEALGMAGLPVYSQQGRNGGWQLAGGGRTDLSGLSAAEARALFLVAGPSSSATPELRAALRKLVRALPESFRDHAEAAWSAVVVDPQGWDGPAASVRPPPPLLDAVQQAVVEGQQIELAYVSRSRESTTRVVHPLGVATKGSVWYLVADTDAGLRTFRVDRMSAVEPTGDPVVRPDSFDLREAWSMITEKVDEMRTPLRTSGAVDQEYLGLCRMMFGGRLSIGPTRADGRVDVELRGHSVRALAGEIAGLGASFEVLDPSEMRDELARIGAQLVNTYEPAGETRLQ